MKDINKVAEGKIYTLCGWQNNGFVISRSVVVVKDIIKIAEGENIYAVRLAEQRIRNQ